MCYPHRYDDVSPIILSVPEEDEVSIKDVLCVAVPNDAAVTWAWLQQHIEQLYQWHHTLRAPSTPALPPRCCASANPAPGRPPPPPPPGGGAGPKSPLPTGIWWPRPRNFLLRESFLTPPNQMARWVSAPLNAGTFVRSRATLRPATTCVHTCAHQFTRSGCGRRSAC